MKHICAHPDCTEEGSFPAPRDPRDLNARQYFCEKHIKEFNRNWNGLSGFKPEEIFSMQGGGATWGRPTWQLGVNTESYRKANAGRTRTADPYTLFEGAQGNTARREKAHSAPTLPRQIQNACDVLNVTDPCDTNVIKKQYVALAKKYHPDVQSEISDDAGEKIKTINDAYRTLREYARRNNK